MYYKFCLSSLTLPRQFWCETIVIYESGCTSLMIAALALWSMFFIWTVQYKPLYLLVNGLLAICLEQPSRRPCGQLLCSAMFHNEVLGGHVFVHYGLCPCSVSHPTDNVSWPYKGWSKIFLFKSSLLIVSFSFSVNSWQHCVWNVLFMMVQANLSMTIVVMYRGRKCCSVYGNSFWVKVCQ